MSVALVLVFSAHSNAQKLALTDQDTVVFLGGTNMVRQQRSGYLETMLTHAFAADSKGPRFRDLSWEADTVDRLGSVIERWRPDGFGGRAEQFKRVGATVAFLQFGQLESMAGDAGLEEFRRGYSNLLTELTDQDIRLVLVTPIPFESSELSSAPDLQRYNPSLLKYISVIKDLGVKHNAAVIDLYQDYPFLLTTNGMHVLPVYQQTVAREIVKQLELKNVGPRKLEALRVAIVEKHRLWYDYWRPANWKLLYGDDSQRGFTRGGDDYIPFREEWSKLLPMVATAEERVWAIASGHPDTGHRRPKPEELHADLSANPKEELAAFTVAEGFDVNLFASDVEGLTSPLSLRWDTSGRMYVTVTTTYPHVFPGDMPNDKIIVLEDIDHDGVADKSSVFADGLNIPTGLELGDGGVYVGQNTEIIFLKDLDGDLKADVREVVLGGFGNGDSHQTINSFIWSPGGELYFGQGDGCESRVETPWGSSDLFQAGFYRLRPRRLQLDPLLDDFMGPGNPWGVAFDKWGQIFSVDGAGGVTYLSPGQIPSHHRLKLRRIGDPGGYCGVAFVDGDHLPKAFQDSFVTCDFKRNRVIQFTVDRRDSGYDLDFEASLIESRHRNFRPVDVRQGPDGAIYVVDWYNPITCHQDDAYRHPDRDKAHGRIWRIAPKTTLEPPADLAVAGIDEVVNALASTNLWERYQAKRECTTREPAEVINSLNTLLDKYDSKAENYEHLLLEMLSTFETLESVNQALLLRCLNSSDERLRAYASRVVGRWHDRLEDPLALLADRVVDVDSQVRMEAIAACAAIPLPRSIVVAARALDLETDYDINYVFKQAVRHLQTSWLPAFTDGRLRFDKANHLAAVLNEAGGRGVIDELKRLVVSGELTGEAKVAAMESIVSMANEVDLSLFALDTTLFVEKDVYDAASHATVLSKAVSVARTVKAEGDLAGLLAKLIDAEDDAVRIEAIKLAGIWKVESLAGSLLDATTEESTSVAVLSTLLNALLDMQSQDARAVIDRIGDDDTSSAEARSVALAALSRLDISEASTRFAAFIEDDAVSANEIGVALTAILERQGGATELAKALAEKGLNESTARLLLDSIFEAGRSDQEILAVITRTLAMDNPVPEYDESYIEQLVDSSSDNGRAVGGKEIFKAIGCASCHKVSGVGGSVGPDLTAVGTTLSGHRISEELLWPQRQVKEGYSLIRVITSEGKVLQGYERKTRETQETGDLLLEDPQSKEILRIKKDDIDVRQKAGSAMPSGLTSLLSREQLLDLIAYLQGLGKL